MIAPRPTLHAQERARSRCGWSPRVLERMTPRILAEGIRREDTTGSLRRFLDRQVLTHRKGWNLRIFGHDLFIFEGAVLITIMHLPAEYHRTADRLAAKRACRTLSSQPSALSSDTGGTA